MENKVGEPWQYGRILDDDAMSDGRSHSGSLGMGMHTMGPDFRQLHQSILSESEIVLHR